MKPLNQHERFRTFLLFSTLFLIGIGIVSIPFFSMYNLMKKENEIVREETKVMKEKMEKLQEQENSQRNFVQQMDKIMQKINKMETPEADIRVLTHDIARDISEAKVFTLTDTSWRSHMYENILKTYSELNEAKFENIEAEESTSDQVIGIKRQLRACQDDLRICQKDLKAKQSKPRIDPQKSQ